MQDRRTASVARWASPALLLGGSLMVMVWLIFTNVHGPTSYDLNRPFLGRGTLFWGMLLGGPPNLLVAAALLVLRPRLTHGANRRARLGFGLAVFGLTIAGALDIFVGAINAPFFIPVVGLGLLLLALGRRASPTLPRAALVALVAIGLVELVAFAWALAPVELYDQVAGYRLYGLLAHVGTGLGWVVLGVSMWPRPLVGR